MVGQREFTDVHDAWVRGKSISEIARQSGRDCKTIRRLLREGAQAGGQAETDQLQARPLPRVPAGAHGR
jgi:predicted transcriptional regulator